MALMKLIAILLVLVSAQLTRATDYWANATTGNNSNNGLTPATAKLTLAAVHALTNPGDRVFCTNGLFNVDFTITRSGSAGNVIWYRFDNAIVRRITLDNVSYVGIVGAEITHTNTTHNDAIVGYSGNCNFIYLIDNNIHDIYSTHGGIVGASGNQPNLKNWTIRGNTITNIGIVNGSVVSDPNVAVSTIYEIPFTSTNVVKAGGYLVEYNTIQWVGDAFNLFGTNNIARNNSIRFYNKLHWGGAPSIHPDGFQPGSDGVVANTRHHVYERNWHGDYIDTDSHFALLQDSMNAMDTGILLRGNVAFNMDGGIGGFSIKKIMGYRNTFYGISPTSPFFIVYSPGGNTNYSTGGYAVNTVSYTSAGISVDLPNTITKNHNWGYLAGSDPSYRGTTDPLFIDPANTNSRNFLLQASSPLRGEGSSPILISSATGSGTSFVVNDGQLLTDGWGMVDGDTVTIGGTTTRVTSISGNTVTVAASVSWSVGDQVHWGSSATEDIGAFPYGSTPLTGATISNVGTTYTVTPTGDARGVWFYVDGIPSVWDSTPPYSAVIASGNVTAKAYALNAQFIPVFTATAGGGPTAPTISSVPAQSIYQDTSTGPLSFTIGDAVDPASSLTVTATSSNHTLADDVDCVLGGSGANRTVNITPNTGQSGVTTIQLVVQNLSLLTATNTFTLTVSATPTTTNVTATVRGWRAILKGKRTTVK